MVLTIVCGATIARAATGGGGAVHVAQISGGIDLGLPPYLDRVLDEATQAGASAVLLEVDTPGGRLDAVMGMQDSLVGAPVRTVAFVDGMALSAGALITIAADEIYLAPGSTLGAATPVLGDTGEPADEKTISAAARSAPPPKSVGAIHRSPPRWSIPTSRSRAWSRPASC
jgi:membrane-bound serine protease (ClpP class)